MTYRRTRTALARGCALGSLALLALGAACAAELPTAAEIQAIDVAAAEEAGTRIALLDDGNAIYRLDGVIVSREEALALTGDKIARIGVSKARTPGGTSEIAIVTRKAGDPVLEPGDPVAVGYGTAVRVRGVKTEGPEPLYLVDGVRQPNGLRDLAPNTIESIHVVKDRDAAVKLAGAEAANGLVVIRTKGGKPDGLDLDGVAVQAPMRVRGVATVPAIGARGEAAPGAGESRMVIRGVVPGGPEPLYIVDGVPRTGTASGSPLSELDPATIESVQVLKDRSATDAYGTRGANGVVIITTKKPAP